MASQSLYKIFSILTWAILLLIFNGMAHPAEELVGGQSAAEQTIIQTCLPNHFQKNDDAYKECIEASENTVVGNKIHILAGLSLDERYAIEQYCSQYKPSDSGLHQACLEQQLSELTHANPPDLSLFPEHEKYVIQQTCFDIQGSQGVKAYQDCIAASIEQLEQLPWLDLNRLSEDENKALQISCARASRHMQDYQDCLFPQSPHMLSNAEPEQLEPQDALVITNSNTSTTTNISTTTTSSTSANANTNTDSSLSNAASLTNLSRDALKQPGTHSSESVDLPGRETINQLPSVTQNNDAGKMSSGRGAHESNANTDITTNVPGASTISNSQPVQALETTDEADQEALASTSPPAAMQTQIEYFKDWKSALTSLQNSVSLKLSSMPDHLTGDKLVVAILTAGSTLLLLLTWIFSRNNSEVLEDETETQNNQHLNAPSVNAPSVNPPSVNLRRVQAHTSEQAAIKNPEYTKVTIADSQAQDNFLPSDNHLQSASNRSDTHFDWLGSQTSSQALSFAIESLLYWIAHADDRLEPSVKKRLLDSEVSSPSDLIKRHTLAGNVELFKSSIRWLQLHSSIAQRIQILKYLMALLVNENALSPNQNVLLRFIADSFGVTNLSQLFEAAYGSRMPDLPRVDKTIWWRSVTEDMLTRWDNQTLRSRSKDIQNRVRLGLPLQGVLDSDLINTRYRRAKNRTTPDNFDLLTDREQALAASQLHRFTETKHSLQEIFA